MSVNKRVHTDTNVSNVKTDRQAGVVYRGKS